MRAYRLEREAGLSHAEEGGLDGRPPDLQGHHNLIGLGYQLEQISVYQISADIGLIRYIGSQLI
jgi:hypothetical protein